MSARNQRDDSKVDRTDLIISLVPPTCAHPDPRVESEARCLRRDRILLPLASLLTTRPFKASQRSSEMRCVEHCVLRRTLGKRTIRILMPRVEMALSTLGIAWAPRGKDFLFAPLGAGCTAACTDCTDCTRCTDDRGCPKLQPGPKKQTGPLMNEGFSAVLLAGLKRWHVG